MYVFICMCVYTYIYVCGACVHVSECVSDDFNLLCVLHLSYSNRFSNVCIVGGSTNPYKKWFCSKSEVGDKHTCKNTPKCSTQCFHKESHESYIPTLSPQWNNIQAKKSLGNIKVANCWVNFSVSPSWLFVTVRNSPSVGDSNSLAKTTSWNWFEGVLVGRARAIWAMRPCTCCWVEAWSRK